MTTPVHPRQAIREAVCAALKYQTSAEERVASSRFLPWPASKLPAIAVYAQREEVVSGEDTAPRELERRLELVLHATVKSGPEIENVENAIDALAYDIERVMHRDSTLGGLASDLVLEGTVIDFDVETNQPVGNLRMAYAVTYYSAAPEAGEDALDPLKTIDVQYDLSHAQEPAAQAHDRLENLDT